MSTYTPEFAPRLSWSGAPRPISDWVCRELGGPVVAARDLVGGFSAGIAAEVRTAAGRRAFVKAVHPALNPATPDRHRHEIVVNRLLPPEAPVPGLRAGFD